MARIEMIDDKPISIYNVNKKELVGIFSNMSVLKKYLKPGSSGNSYSSLHQALRLKGCLRKSRFDFKVAIRFATQEHISELGDCHAVIRSGYPECDSILAKGFTDNRISLSIGSKQRLEKFRQERSNTFK
jgi:hypothetical protein